VQRLDVGHEAAVKVEEFLIGLDERNGWNLLLNIVELPNAGIVNERAYTNKSERGLETWTSGEIPFKLNNVVSFLFRIAAEMYGTYRPA
jgi:hypothetical protein